MRADWRPSLALVCAHAHAVSEAVCLTHAAEVCVPRSAGRAAAAAQIRHLFADVGLVAEASVAAGVDQHLPPGGLGAVRDDFGVRPPPSLAEAGQVLACPARSAAAGGREGSACRGRLVGWEHGRAVRTRQHQACHWRRL